MRESVKICVDSEHHHLHQSGRIGNLTETAGNVQDTDRRTIGIYRSSVVLSQRALCRDGIGLVSMAP